MSDYNIEGWVRLGEVAINIIGMQCQYASRYLTQNEVKEIRWRYDSRCSEKSGDYHSIYLHPDDVDSFVSQVKEIRSRYGG